MCQFVRSARPASAAVATAFPDDSVLRESQSPVSLKRTSPAAADQPRSLFYDTVHDMAVAVPGVQGDDEGGLQGYRKAVATAHETAGEQKDDVPRRAPRAATRHQLPGAPRPCQ